MTNTQELPHDNALERGVFNALFDTPDQFMEVMDLLSANDFFEPAHQQLWGAMLQLFQEGKPIDFPSVRLVLKQQGADIDPRPALDALSQSLQEQVQSYHLPSFVQEVKNKSLLRQIIKLSKAHAWAGQVDGAKAPELITNIEKDMVGLLDKVKETQPTSADGIMVEIRKDLAKGLKDGWHGFNSGFAKLDEVTGGFIPGQTWIIGAYTGSGKTFLILQMLLNVLRQGGRVALFSTEMDRKLNLLRMVGNIAGVGTIQMMRNRLNDEQRQQMTAAQEELASFKDQLLIYDDVRTTAAIRTKTKKLQLNGGVNIVAVDYLQNLREPGVSIYERMATAATDLYSMALELKPTLLIGSQVSQAAAGWQSKEAIEFKGAGEIAAVADVALWMKRLKIDPSIDTKQTPNRQILLRKVRHGEDGQFEARLDFPAGRFIDLGTTPTEHTKERDENADTREQIAAF